MELGPAVINNLLADNNVHGAYTRAFFLFCLGDGSPCKKVCLKYLHGLRIKSYLGKNVGSKEQYNALVCYNKLQQITLS